MDHRLELKNKKRVVVKVGSSSLTHPETGRLDLHKIEVLVRELSDLRNAGIEVVLVTSGAIMVGRNALQFTHKPTETSEKQACAAVGQARLMMIYQKLFSEYNQVAAQILITKDVVREPRGLENARQTFNELLKLHVIPVVNENDTIATEELEALAVFGDNDTLSAVVSSMIGADLLILLSDIDGLYTDDPRSNPDAEFVSVVESLNDRFMKMGKGTTGSNVGTGGMRTKMIAANIAVHSGADMVIASGSDFHVIHRIISGENVGTLFIGNEDKDMDLLAFLND